MKTWRYLCGKLFERSYRKLSNDLVFTVKHGLFSDWCHFDPSTTSTFTFTENKYKNLKIFGIRDFSTQRVCRYNRKGFHVDSSCLGNNNEEKAGTIKKNKFSRKVVLAILNLVMLLFVTREIRKRKRQKRERILLSRILDPKFFDGYLFDFDDTLVDSDTKKLKPTFKHACYLAPECKKMYKLKNILFLKRLIKKRHDEEAVRLFYQTYEDNIRKNHKNMTEDESVDTFFKLWFKYYRENVTYFPETIPLLRFLKKKNPTMKFVVVTNSVRKFVELVDENESHSFKISEFFDVVLSLEDYVEKPKPDPYPYQLACERINSVPSRCVVFEDKDHGVDAGKKAGCVVVGVINGYNSRKKLKNADIIITYKELIEFMKKDKE